MYTPLILLFFFFKENFNLCRPFFMIALYHQIKILISFWCRRGLNPKFLIQLSETLPLELTRTHSLILIIYKMQQNLLLFEAWHIN